MEAQPSTSQRTTYKSSSMDLCLQKQHWLSLPILCLLNWPLTWFHLVNGLDLGQLDGCYPTLSFSLWWAFEVICLRASIGNDEATGVLWVDERVEDADGTTRCTACHICLTPVIHTQKFATVGLKFDCTWCEHNTALIVNKFQAKGLYIKFLWCHTNKSSSCLVQIFSCVHHVLAVTWCI